MIRVIAVDDEQPALRRVGKLLESFDEVHVSGLFDSALSFLEHALTSPETIDLVLLDMEMPGLHGLELARRLHTFRPEIRIAFLTAYEEFALEAFEVEAIDYLLKPVTNEDLSRAISRFRKRSRLPAVADGTLDRGVAIRSFGPFSVTPNKGEPVRFRNSKGLELLAYMHYHGGKPVSKSQILDEIWHGQDVERTQVNLHSTVYQLRKDLEAYGLNESIEQSKTAGGSYCVRWPVGFDDVAEYEKQYRQYKQTTSLTHVLRAVQLYGDGFLAGSGYGWAAPRQAEIELSYTELLEAMANTYVRQHRYEIALNPLKKWVQLLPLDTRLHAKMIALLLLMNRETDALAYHELALELLEQTDESSELDFSRLSANPTSLFCD